MKIGKRGQVTIPSALRETLGLMPGTEVEFEMGDDSVFLRLKSAAEPAQDRFERWLKKAAGSATIDLSASEVMALTRSSD